MVQFFLLHSVLQYVLDTVDWVLLVGWFPKRPPGDTWWMVCVCEMSVDHQVTHGGWCVCV